MAQNRKLPAKSESPLIKESGLFTEILNLKKRAFLAAFCQCGRIVKACKEAGIHWTSHYGWLRKDKSYAEAFEASKQIAADHFEDERFTGADMKAMTVLSSTKARSPTTTLIFPIHWQSLHLRDFALRSTATRHLSPLWDR